jgi:hypothetical protein
LAWCYIDLLYGYSFCWFKWGVQRIGGMKVITSAPFIQICIYLSLHLVASYCHSFLTDACQMTCLSTYFRLRWMKQFWLPLLGGILTLTGTLPGIHLSNNSTNKTSIY